MTKWLHRLGLKKRLILAGCLAAFVIATACFLLRNGERDDFPQVTLQGGEWVVDTNASRLEILVSIVNQTGGPIAFEKDKTNGVFTAGPGSISTIGIHGVIMFNFGDDIVELKNGEERLVPVVFTEHPGRFQPSYVLDYVGGSLAYFECSGFGLMLSKMAEALVGKKAVTSFWIRRKTVDFKWSDLKSISVKNHLSTNAE